jgi:hypothetical protein
MTDFMLREQKNPTFYRGLWRARGEQKRQKICVFLAVSTAAVRARGLSALTRQRIDAVISRSRRKERIGHSSGSGSCESIGIPHRWRCAGGCFPRRQGARETYDLPAGIQLGHSPEKNSRDRSLHACSRRVPRAWRNSCSLSGRSRGGVQGATVCGSRTRAWRLGSGQRSRRIDRIRFRRGNDR